MRSWLWKHRHTGEEIPPPNTTPFGSARDKGGACLSSVGAGVDRMGNTYGQHAVLAVGHGTALVMAFNV